MVMWQVSKWSDWNTGVTFMTTFVSKDPHSDMMPCRIVNSYLLFAGGCRFCLQDARSPRKGNLLYLHQQVNSIRNKQWTPYCCIFSMLSQKADLYFKWTGDVLILWHKKYNTWTFKMQAAAFSTTAVTICQRHANISHKAYTSTLTSQHYTIAVLNIESFSYPGIHNVINWSNKVTNRSLADPSGRAV